MLNTYAFAAQGPGVPLGPFQFQRREPGPDDVVLAIEYCAICHSDIHQARNEWGKSIFPMVPGHEIAGRVTKVGDQVEKFVVGDRVGVGCLVDSCRACADCQQGEEQYCDHPILTYNGYEKDGKTPTYGGYSTQMVVDQRYLLKIPTNLPLDRASPLLCAGITTYSPLKYWQVGPGKKVAILGLGGLGHMAVKFATAMGAEVTVLSRSLQKVAAGKKLGAAHFYSTSDMATFERLTRQFDLILNTVSVEINWNQYLKLLNRDGVMVLLGIPEKPSILNSGDLIFRRRSLAGSLIGGIRETQEMLNFCSKQEITAEIETIPIQQVNEAYERMIRGDVQFRFVIDIKQSLGL